jgi:hypothetical protein
MRRPRARLRTVATISCPRLGTFAGEPRTSSSASARRPLSDQDKGVARGDTRGRARVCESLMRGPWCWREQFTERQVSKHAFKGRSAPDVFP